jgi:hypothetical protein
VIYYKIVVAGRPQVVFAGVEKLVAGSGEAVARTLLHRLKKDGITIEKVMAFGSDGASVMLGHVGGVAGILLSMNLLLVAFHCVNHRGALAIEGAADESSYLINKFIPTIEALGRFFKYSHARNTSFKDAQAEWQEFVGADDIKKFIKVCESAFTRWLTHDKTTASIRRSFIPLCIGLDHDAEARGDATARGLLVELLSFPFIGFMMILSDIFPVLARFSRITQKSAADVDLDAFFKELPLVIKVLQSMATGVSDADLYYGFLGEFLEDVRLPEADGGPELEVQARGTQDAKWLEGARTQFLTNLVRHLESRFPDHSLMNSFYVLLNAPGYPERADELHEFLKPHAKVVLGHYSKIGTLRGVDFTVLEDYQVGQQLTHCGDHTHMCVPFAGCHGSAHAWPERRWWARWLLARQCADGHQIGRGRS